MLRLRRLFSFAVTLVFGLALLVTGSTANDQIEVDAELILAVDVSRSMTARELEIQRRGYAEALTDERVVAAITGGLIGRVAITYVEWAGTFSQRVIVDWSLIASEADARTFANKLTAQFDSALRRTSISGALDYTSAMFDRNGFTSNRQIIDISGDGPNNQGRPVLAARADVLARGIVINGLPLMTREGMGSQFHLEDLDVYYSSCVIGGPGAFVVPVLEWEQFPAAVRQKMILELAGKPEKPATKLPVFKAQFSGQSPGQSSDNPLASNYDCLIGEKMWEIIRQNWQTLP